MKLAQRIVLKYYRNKFNTLSVFSPRKAAELAFKLFCTPYTRKRNYKAPPVFNKASKVSLQFDNEEVNGFRWVPEKHYNGLKILICHGFDSYSYRFDNYVEALINEGFEVLAFDAPAHGISHGKTINIIQYRNMIIKINEAYGPIDGIMAHSFGGLAVALAIEKITNNPCKRLVLMAPATETTHAINTFFKYLKLNSKVQSAFHQIIEEYGGNPASWYSVSRVMQNVQIPTLWVHDKEDSITPYEDIHPLLNQSLPHIIFEITTGLGHSLYRDDSITRRIVEYFAELKSPQCTTAEIQHKP